jgi:AcrR family transcriptional regulator
MLIENPLVGKNAAGNDQRQIVMRQNPCKERCMSPRYVNKAKKRQKIVQAALALFSQKGYAATSVGSIANEAGVGKGTIYEYFNSKADILVAAVMEWIRKLEKRYLKHLETIEDPVRRLQAFVDMSMDLVDPIDPGTARLSIDVLQHTLLKTGVLYRRRHLMRETHTGMRKIVVNILLDGISSGVFRPEVAREAEKIAINLLGYLDGISLHYLISKNDFDIREQIRFSLQHIIRMITADPLAENSPAPAFPVL